jgi:hypothetical protein
MLKYFKRKLKRYEVISLMAHISVKDEMLKKAQEQGWGICGDILIKNESGGCNSTFFHIPMKRKIK